MANWSLPAREAWIEMYLPEDEPVGQHRRFPHGKRGLKWTASAVSCVSMPSLPAREAWIEMRRSSSAQKSASSLPAREAWIEMPGGDVFAASEIVASRTGSVD